MQNLKSQAKDKVRKFARRKIRINTQIKAVNPDYRVIVNRSNMYVTAQVLDINGKVVASVSDKGQKEATKTLRAQGAGQSLAKMLIDKGVKSAAFDRNGYLYHGRVKAFAQGLRDGGFAI